ncbi:carbohydrate kinase family protein [Candidatus Gracilibacteria bacterium]|nr:carbohydrate kinase family protein [Candidatus Gracilibacteria bacterium]
MKVLGIGEVVIDKTYFIPEFPTEGLKYQATDSVTSIGGPVPAALKLLRNMGAEVTLIGSVGKDPDSIRAEAQFDEYGIDTFLVYDTSTKVNTVIVNEKNGARTIFKDKICNELITEIPIHFIQEADIIIFDRSEPIAFDFVLKHKRPETQIVVDPSCEYNDKITHMMQNSTVAIFPIETVDNMSKKYNMRHNLELLYKEIGKTLIITDGGNGTYIFDGEERIVIPSLDIVPIDTNGAGDVFRGAFAWGLLNNWETKKTVEFANKVAGLQCTKKGNLTAVPSLEEIQK